MSMPTLSPEQSPSKLPWSARIGYAAGDYSLNLFWKGTEFFLLFFYTHIVGLPNSVAGLIIMIGGIWDALSDPVMGYLAERTNSEWGAYRPYLLFGSIPLALSFALLFWAPTELQGWPLYAVVLFILLIFRTCYTLVSIPYSTLGARMTSDSHERTRLTGVRMMGGFLGGLTVIGLANLLRGPLADKDAFFTLGLICAGISVFVLLFCFRQTKVAARRPKSAPKARSLSELLISLRRNRAFLLILLAVSCVAVGSVFINATILYYFEDALGDKAAGETALLIMAGTPIFAIPAWSAIALRLDKRPAWLLGCAVVVLGTFMLYLDRSGSLLSAYFTYMLLNFGFSAFAVLFWSMLPDTIEYGEHKTGVRNESSIIGVVSSGQKISLAMSAFALGLMLDRIGYTAGAIQSPETVNGLRVMIASVAGGSLALSAALILFYPINATLHQQILSDLAQRHGSNTRPQADTDHHAQ